MRDRSTRRVALITGGSRGLGFTLAGLLAEFGWDLVLTGRDSKSLSAAATELEGSEISISSVAGDVADPAHRDRLAAVATELGRLDLLVNNASALGPSPLPELSRYPLDALRRVFEVNVVAPVALVQTLLPLLERSGGIVVNVSSDAAGGGYPSWGGYGASKAALDLVTATLANELDARGVTAVSVDPGDLRTQMQQDAFPGEDISDRPLPEVTIPFWTWLLGQDPKQINGLRFKAQAERWESR